MNYTVDKKAFKEAIKRQHANCGCGGILEAINIKVKDGKLVLVSTNDCRLLETSITTANNSKNHKAVNINGRQLYNLKFIKSDLSFDVLGIKFAKDGIVITDVGNQITYKLPQMQGRYPKYEQLFPNISNYTKFSFNADYLKRCAEEASVNPMSKHVNFYADPESVLSNVVFTANSPSDHCSSRSLLMPIRVRKSNKQ